MIVGARLRAISPKVVDAIRLELGYAAPPSTNLASDTVQNPALGNAIHSSRGRMSGLRRSDAPSRASTPIVGYGRGLVKINPIATWGDLEVAAYIAAHDVPVNPLVQRGFPSIGCLPCTGRIRG